LIWKGGKRKIESVFNLIGQLPTLWRVNSNFLPPLSPMIDGLYRDQLGLNEILVDQSAPDLGSKNLEDKRLKGPIN